MLFFVVGMCFFTRCCWATSAGTDRRLSSSCRLTHFSYGCCFSLYWLVFASLCILMLYDVFYLIYILAVTSSFFLSLLDDVAVVVFIVVGNVLFFTLDEQQKQ